MKYFLGHKLFYRRFFTLLFSGVKSHPENFILPTDPILKLRFDPQGCSETGPAHLAA